MVGVNDATDKRASSDSRDKRWYESRFPFRGVFGTRRGESSASANSSSSIVGSTGAGVLVLANSSSLPHFSCSLSTPAVDA